MSKRVVMLVVSDGNDVRALKEAHSLAEAGYDVRFVGRKLGIKAAYETEIQGIPTTVVPGIYDAATLRAAAERCWHRLGFAERNVVRLMLRAFRATRTSLIRRSEDMPPIEAPANAIERRLGARYEGAGLALYGKFQYFLFYLEMGAAAAQLRPDILHAHDLYMLQTAARVATETGAAYVYDAHELEYDRVPNLKLIDRWWIWQQELRWSYDADCIITISESTRRHMTDRLGNSGIELIFNAPVLCEAPGPGLSDIRTATGVSDDTPLLVFVGKIFDIHVHDHKVDLLIQSLVLNPDFHLALLGNRSPKAVEQIEAWATRFRVRDRVHMIEPVHHSHIIDFIRTADAGVYAMPSHSLNIEYSMPNKVFEYALAGLPVAYSDLTDARQFYTLLNTGEPLDPSDVRDIARACRVCYERRTEFRLMGERLERVRRDYSWDAQARKLVALYDRIAESTRQRA